MHSDPSTTFQGGYSDGRTASRAPADVRLSERGIEIGFPGAPQALVWPYGALTTPTPISAASQDVLVGYTFMEGASLFVADPRFVQALAKAAPQLTARSHGWRSARPWLVAAAVIAIVIGAIWAADLSPARWVANLMPDGVRQNLGRHVIASMAGNRKVCEAPGGQAALGRMVERLSAVSGTRARFDVKVYDWGLLNAFAAPGEQIVLTRELIQRAQSPDEIAGVLAHEMGHGIERHPETSIVRIVGLTAALELMMGGGGGTLANIGLLLTQLGYSRVAEREADGHALRMLEQARIASKGLVDFFSRVEEIEKKSGAPEWSILRSHPPTAERAKASADRQAYAATPALSAEDWQALRTICSVTSAGPVEKGEKR